MQQYVSIISYPTNNGIAFFLLRFIILVGWCGHRFSITTNAFAVVTVNTKRAASHSLLTTTCLSSRNSNEYEDSSFTDEADTLFQSLVFPLDGDLDDEDDEDSGETSEQSSIAIMEKLYDEAIMDFEEEQAAEIMSHSSDLYPNHKHLVSSNNIAYFYLKNIIGLNEPSMVNLIETAPSILGLKVQNLQEKVALLQRTMNLSPDDICTILSKQPSILCLSATRNLSSTILFLVRALDLGKDDLKTLVVQYPCILCYSMDNLNEKLSFFFDDSTMGYETIEDVRELLVAEPRLLMASVTTGLKPRAHFFLKTLQVPIQEFCRMVIKNPKLLLYSVSDNMEPKFYYLQNTLQMELPQIHKVLIHFPKFVDYNLDNHLIPIINYFLVDLKFPLVQFRKVLSKFPKLVSYSLLKMKHVVGYFQYEVGMDTMQVQKVLYQAPQLLSMDMEHTVQSKLDFLRHFYQLDSKTSGNSNLQKVITTMPRLLLYSLEKNMQPKSNYLLQQLDNDGMELRQALLTLPSLLGYSLEKRIQPRMKLIQDVGIEPIKITVALPMNEKRFEKWLQGKKNKIETETKIQLENEKKKKKKMEKRAKEQEMMKSQKLPPLVDDEDNERKGRIVNWKR